MARRRSQTSGFGGRFDRGLALNPGPRKVPGWGLARPRDLLRGLDAENPWRAWRQGMDLAATATGELQSQVYPARLLHADAFSADGRLSELKVVQMGWASESSPDGRWTVTILPRGANSAPMPLTAAGQQDVTVRWRQLNAIGKFEDRQWRLLRVEVGPVWAQASGLESDLVGELVEDSLLPDGSYRPDDTETRLRMVVAVDGSQGVIWLDGEREWRRERIDPGGGQTIRWRLIERRIIPEESILLQVGMRLTQSTTVSCNCPQALGIVLQDWRRGPGYQSRQLGESPGPAQQNLLGGGLMPAGTDPVDAVGRRFKGREWQRNPMRGCKHEHATRFGLGCPVAEPREMLSLVNDYWDFQRSFRDIEEMGAPLAYGKFVEMLQRNTEIDAAWQGIDPLVQAIGAAEAISVQPSELALPARVLETPSTFAAGRNLPAPRRRFHRSWYDVRPVLTEDAQQGDVWLGRGGQIPEPFTGPAQTVGEPFLLRLYGQQAAIPLMP